MASVGRDLRNGRWLARWRDPAGRQHKKSFRRKIDAQRWLDQMQAEMHRGQYIDPAGAKLRVGTFAESWAAGLGHLKPSTRERYRGIVRKHIVPTWGTWPLGSVAHSDVATWLAELSDSGLRPGTVRQVHRVLSLILDAAVQDGRIGRNPAAGGTAPAPRTQRAQVPHRRPGGQAGGCGRSLGADGPRAVVHGSPVRRAGGAQGQAGGLRAAASTGGRERDGGRRPVGVVDAEDTRNQVGPGATVAHRAARGGLRRQER